MKENKIEKLLAEEVRRLGGRAYKWTSPENNGVPDRIVILPGRVPIFTELKTETGKLSAIQQVQIRRLESLGQRVEVIYGEEGLIRYFRELGLTDSARRLSRKLFGR